MTGLVFLAGALAAASGLLKVFGKGRRPGEVPLLGLLEVLAGVIVPFYALGSRPPPTVLGPLTLGLFGLIFLSSLLTATRARARRKHREATESGRLVTYVKYLSSQPERGGANEGRD
jgi:membrane associated rhomboid family serine protease